MFDDRVVQAGVALLLLYDFAKIDAVLPHQIERAAGKRLAARGPIEPVDTELADDVVAVEFILEGPD